MKKTSRPASRFENKKQVHKFMQRYIYGKVNPHLIYTGIDYWNYIVEFFMRHDASNEFTMLLKIFTSKPMIDHQNIDELPIIYSIFFKGNSFKLETCCRSYLADQFLQCKHENCDLVFKLIQMIGKAVPSKIQILNKYIEKAFKPLTLNNVKIKQYFDETVNFFQSISLNRSEEIYSFDKLYPTTEMLNIVLMLV